MKTLYIDPNTQDLVIDGQGEFIMIDGTQEKKQALRMLLLTYLGEFFLETWHGTDYSEILGARPGDEDLIKGVIRQALEQEERVDDILELEVEFQFNK